MSLCESQHHPQVPVTCASVLMTYCWSCQAWTVYASRHTQTGSEDPTFEVQREMHLGPFDGLPQMLAIALAYIDDLVSGSGLPWDRSGW